MAAHDVKAESIEKSEFHTLPTIAEIFHLTERDGFHGTIRSAELAGIYSHHPGPLPLGQFGPPLHA